MQKRQVECKDNTVVETDGREESPKVPAHPLDTGTAKGITGNVRVGIMVPRSVALSQKTNIKATNFSRVVKNQLEENPAKMSALKSPGCDAGTDYDVENSSRERNPKGKFEEEVSEIKKEGKSDSNKMTEATEVAEASVEERQEVCVGGDARMDSMLHMEHHTHDGDKMECQTLGGDEEAEEGVMEGVASSSASSLPGLPEDYSGLEESGLSAIDIFPTDEEFGVETIRRRRALLSADKEGEVSFASIFTIFVDSSLYKSGGITFGQY